MDRRWLDMDDKEYISERLDNQQQWYSKKSRSYHAWYKRLQIVQLVAGASIPLLASYISDESTWITMLIGVLGVFIAVITGLIALNKYEEKWIKYRTTAESLKHEKYRFLTHSIPYNVDNPFPVLVERVESLISQENRDWSQYIAKKPEQVEE